MFKFLLVGLVALFLLTGCNKEFKESSDNMNKASDAPKAGGVPQVDYKKPTPIKVDTQKIVHNPKDTAGWKEYKNDKFGYAVNYPKEWYYTKDTCCPPPPANVSFNNYSEKMLEYAKRQFEKGMYNFDILCLYEGNIDDIGEVKLYREERVESEKFEINNSKAIKFTKDGVPGDSSEQIFSHYVSNGASSCRITYTSRCPSCEKILSSFQYIK